MRKLAVLLWLVSLPVPAEVLPTFFDGRDVLEYCDGKQALCQGFLIGVNDAHAAMVDAGGFAPLYCPPADVLGKELTDIAIRYLRDNPQFRYTPAGSSALVAWMESFPCE